MHEAGKASRPSGSSGSVLAWLLSEARPADHVLVIKCLKPEMDGSTEH